jgi:hypothetical protein
MSRANFFSDSTSKIKAMADVRPIAIDDADSIIRSFHLHLIASNSGEPAQDRGEVVVGNGV